VCSRQEYILYNAFHGLGDSRFYEAMKELMAEEAKHRQEREQEERESQIERVRELAARNGYKMINRRGGHYWLMFGRPLILDAIEKWIKAERDQLGDRCGIEKTKEQ